MDNYAHSAYKITIIGAIANIFLAVLKLIFGIAFFSSALIADAIHSFSDLISDVIILASIKISSKPKSKAYPYGLGKIETLAAILVAILLLFIGVEIIKKAYLEIISGNIRHTEPLAIIAAVVSVAVKEALFRYTYAVGRKINSPSLVANAYHHRSDAVTSIAVLVGIVCVIAGYPIFDPLASVVVSGFIIYAAYGIGIEAIKELLDVNIAPTGLLEDIYKNADSIKGIKAVNDVRIRKYGPKYSIELIMVVEPDISAEKAVDLKDKLCSKLLKSNQNIDTVLISIEISGKRRVEYIKNDTIFDKIKDIVYQFDDVIGLHNVVIEKSYNELYVNLDIEVEGSLSVKQAHDIGEKVKNKLIDSLNIADVRFHIDPYDKNKEVNNRLFVKEKD